LRLKLLTEQPLLEIVGVWLDETSAHRTNLNEPPTGTARRRRAYTPSRRCRARLRLPGSPRSLRIPGLSRASPRPPHLWSVAAAAR
jgi:hypothetical protein